MFFVFSACFLRMFYACFMCVIRMFLCCIMLFICCYSDVYSVIDSLKIIFGKIYPLEMLFRLLFCVCALYNMLSQKKKNSLPLFLRAHNCDMLCLTFVHSRSCKRFYKSGDAYLHNIARGSLYRGPLNNITGNIVKEA